METQSRGTGTEINSIAEVNQSLFLTEDIYKHLNNNRRFKLHFLFGIFLSVLVFSIWLIIDLYSIQWPWFIYPIGVLLIGVAIHYYTIIHKAQYLPLHFACYAIINGLLFLSWGSQITRRSVWFVYPLGVLSIFLAIHYIIAKVKKDVGINSHIVVFTIINTLAFIGYLDSGKGQPWFVYVLFITAGVLAVHYHLKYFPEDWMKLHITLFIILQTFFFFAWAINHFDLPWFAIPLLVWGLLLAIHMYFNKSPSPPESTPTVLTIGSTSAPVEQGTAAATRQQEVNSTETNNVSVAQSSTDSPVMQEISIKVDSALQSQ